MTQPTPYTIQTDFSEEDASGVSGRSTVRTAALDAELTAIAASIASMRTNIGIVQRDDTELRDQIVKPHTLHPDVLSMFNTTLNPRGPWLTTTSYAVMDLVSESGNTYICIVAHTSGTFATDLAADKWMAFSFNLASDAELAAISGLVSAADTLPYFTGSGAAALSTFTSFGRQLVATANAAAARTLLGILSGNGSFTSVLSGAVARTVDNKLGDIVSVKDFGATGDGSTDDTAAIAAAITALAAAGGGALYFPAGVYLFTSLSITSGYITLQGAGKYSSILKCNSANGGVTFTGSSLPLCGVRHMGFLQATDSTTSTAALLKTSGVFRFTVYDCMFNGYSGASNYAHNLLSLSGTSVYVIACDGSGGKTAGLYITGGNDYFVHANTFQMSAVTGRALYIDGVTGGAMQFSSNAFLEGSNCLINNSNFGNFTDCWFDSAQGGLAVSGCEALSFLGCGFANRVTTGSGDGVGIVFGNSKSCSVIASKICNCGTDGVQIAADCDRIKLFANDILDNNTTNAAGTFGVDIAANASGWIMIGNTVGNASSLLTGYQRYGVGINTGTSDNFLMVCNDLRGNVTGGYADNSTGVNKCIQWNLVDGTPTIPTPVGKLPSIPIGAVAYGSLGTDAVHVAGTIYVTEIYVPMARWVNGIGILNGGVAADNGIVALYGPDGGAPIANSTTAGAAITGTNVFQEYAFTAPKLLMNPGRYFIAFQCDGTTGKTRRMAASTYLNLCKSFAGAFGTIGNLTVPTTFSADTGPIGYLY